LEETFPARQRRRYENNFGPRPWNVFVKGKRYLGLSLQLNGETYYGWVRLRLLKGGAEKAHLAGYAYESTPGMPINAGQTK
jgi:hypothetical protein